jgi:hypothetical protein
MPFPSTNMVANVIRLPTSVGAGLNTTITSMAAKSLEWLQAWTW